MISVSSSQTIARSALEWVRRSGLEPDYVVDAPIGPLGQKRMAAQRFAERVINERFNKDKKGKKKFQGLIAVIVGEYSLPSDEYISWLLVGPDGIGIAFDSSKTIDHAIHGNENPPCSDIQIARAIFHELGHIFMTSELLSTDRERIVKNGRTYTPAATAEQEEKAWVWAIFALAIQLGHHARTRGDEYDDAVAANL